MRLLLIAIGALAVGCTLSSRHDRQDAAVSTGDAPPALDDAAPSGNCGDQFCDTASEDCTSCALDCGACPGSCGDGTCDGGERCLECPEDCGICEGSCCTEHPTPGCDDPQITNCICAVDIRCCQGPWNAACINVVNLDICTLCPVP